MATGKKTACVLGGNGFIGHHMARRLKSEGYYVRVVDIKEYEYGPNDYADEVVIADLRDPRIVEASLRLQNFEYSFLKKPFEEIVPFDEVYAFACLMGGAGFVFTGDNDADIMHDSALINLNVVAWAQIYGVGKLFYSSSACMYPQELQDYQTKFKTGNALKESDAYPANPDSEYGWEKLFSERLFLAYQRNYNLNVRIARFHNIYGPEGTYKGGKEKAPAAMCRKVIERDGDSIEVWGTGNQTRSFLYIDDCIDAVRLLMQSEFKEPINIGSEEMISINGLAKLAIGISEKSIEIKNIDGPVGVMGRNSDNTLIEKILGWKPKYSLKEGLEKTYWWIKSQYA
jgi:GDP-D-mannose 3',5'-epimerase